MLARGTQKSPRVIRIRARASFFRREKENLLKGDAVASRAKRPRRTAYKSTGPPCYWGRSDPLPSAPRHGPLRTDPGTRFIIRGDSQELKIRCSYAPPPPPPPPHPSPPHPQPFIIYTAQDSLAHTRKDPLLMRAIFRRSMLARSLLFPPPPPAPHFIFFSLYPPTFTPSVIPGQPINMSPRVLQLLCCNIPVGSPA
jgi:hypothetical protein